MKISNRLLFLILTIVLLLVTVIGTIFYVQMEGSIFERTYSQLESVSVLKENQLRYFISRELFDLQSLLKDDRFLSHINDHLNDVGTLNEEHDYVIESLKNKLDEGYFKEIFLLSNKGEVILSTDEKQLGKYKTNEKYFIEGLKAPYLQGFYYSFSLQHPSFVVSIPLKEGNISIGVIVARLDLDRISQIMKERSGLGITGETYLVDKFNFAVSELAKEENAIFKKTIYSSSVKNCLKKKNGEELSEDYANDIAITNYKWIDDLQICLVSQINENEAMKPFWKTFWTFSLIVMVVIILTLVAGLTFARSISQPVKKLQEASKRISAGDYNINIKLDSKDELGDLANAFNIMAKGIKKARSNLIKADEKRTEQLKEEVDKATKKLQIRIKKEEKAGKAMLFMLEDLDKSTKEALESKKLVQRNQKELNKKNIALEKQTKALIKIQSELENQKAHIEQVVNRRTAQLNKEKRKVENLLDMKTTFMNQVAHDLRTPLTPIVMLMPTLKKHLLGKLDKKDSERFEIVLKNAEYLSVLVNDTLNLSRLDAGTVKFNFESIKPYDLVKEIIENEFVVFEQNNIQIINKVKKQTPKVFVDKVKIRQVFENLISNAVKYIGGGEKITLLAEVKGSKIKFGIKDDGIGIENKNINEIFEEFYKVDASRHKQSFGLGLAICKRIVAQHKGRIWAESKGTNKGTTFWFTVPKAK